MTADKYFVATRTLKTRRAAKKYFLDGHVPSTPVRIERHYLGKRIFRIIARDANGYCCQQEKYS